MNVEFILALLLATIFAVLLRLLGLRQATTAVWRQCVDSTAVLRSNATELEKERAARRGAFRLAKLGLLIIGKLALALAIPFGLMYGFAAIGWSTVTAMEQALLSPALIAVGVILTLVVAFR